MFDKKRAVHEIMSKKMSMGGPLEQQASEQEDQIEEPEHLAMMDFFDAHEAKDHVKAAEAMKNFMMLHSRKEMSED